MLQPTNAASRRPSGSVVVCKFATLMSTANPDQPGTVRKGNPRWHPLRQGPTKPPTCEVVLADALAAAAAAALRKGAHLLAAGQPAPEAKRRRMVWYRLGRYCWNGPERRRRASAPPAFHSLVSILAGW